MKTNQRPSSFIEDSGSRMKLVLAAVCVAAIGIAGVSIFVTSRDANRPGQDAYQNGMAALASGNITSARSEFIRGVQVDPDFAR